MAEEFQTDSFVRYFFVGLLYVASIDHKGQEVVDLGQQVSWS